MNALFLAALSAAALFVSTSSADASAPNNPAGHWVWLHTAQYGPRAASPTSRRVWIADAAAIAASYCGNMPKALSSTDCMAMMATPSAAPAKG
jgi:hypothetical protein